MKNNFFIMRVFSIVLLLMSTTVFALDCSPCTSDNRRYCGVYDFSTSRWFSGAWESCSTSIPQPPPPPAPAPSPSTGGSLKPEVRCDVCSVDGQRTCRVINYLGDITNTFTESCIPTDGLAGPAKTVCGSCAYPGEMACRVINNRGVVTGEFRQSCQLDPNLYSCGVCSPSGSGYDMKVCYSVHYQGVQVANTGCSTVALWANCRAERDGDTRCRMSFGPSR